MKKLILTAFEPFGGEQVNPSAQAVERLPRRIGDVEIATLILPVVFGKSVQKLKDAMDELRPDAVFSIGQAGGRAELTPERIAVNMMDARIPDNEKKQPRDVPICADGPAAYFSTLPVRAIADAIRGQGLPARLSNTAGLYVCNAVMYGALHHAARALPRCICGFMHVPFSPQQAAAQSTPQPSMAIDDAARGITAAVNAIDAFLKDR
ncbi:MAG: pyroglutamyl-peptidase I [Pyramidobacter sp.]|jgi:pyroglutamyl-peptidase